MTISDTTPARDRGVDPAFVEALTTFISQQVSTGDQEIAADTDLLLTGLVDSLGVVMIVEWIEAELDVVIDPGDVVLEHFQTIEAMASYLRTQ